MPSDSKEKIFVELRQYHLDTLPEKLANETMNKYGAEFSMLQDKVISMILGFVARKTSFIDFSSELVSLKNKFAVTKRSDHHESANRKNFVSKIEDLLRISNIAQAANFTIKLPRVRKSLPKAV